MQNNVSPQFSCFPNDGIITRPFLGKAESKSALGVKVKYGKK